MNYENLTINHQKTLARFENIEAGVDSLRQLFELGYRTKSDVYIQLVMHNPKYSFSKYKNKYVLLWNGVQHDIDIINDLYAIIDKINAR